MREVLIDVNVGLPRCGCSPPTPAVLPSWPARAGLEVRGVMGYEGHTMMVKDRADRARQVADSMALLEQAHAAVGGPIRSAGGTGSWDLNVSATELQAGSYALMDTDYASLGLPFGPALSILATVISVNPGGWAVADCGLKALGMDHGNPSLADGSVVWFCSDEHVVFSPPEGGSLPSVGDLRPGVPPTSTRPWPTTSGCTWYRTTGCLRRGRWTCGAGNAFPSLRLASTMGQMQAFYDAAFPLLDGANKYLERFGMDNLPDPERNRLLLMMMMMSLVLVSFRVEVWSQPRVPDSGAAYLEVVEPRV